LIYDPASQPDIARKRAMGFPGVINQSRHFFASGVELDYYIDIDRLIDDPFEAEQIVQWYVDTIFDIQAQNPFRPIDYLVFVDKAGDVGAIGALRLAAAISIESRIPNVVVRLGKHNDADHIRFRFRQEGAPSGGLGLAGRRFAVCTDICATGHQVLDVVGIISEAGGEVSHLLTYVAIEEVFARSREELMDRGAQVHVAFRAPTDLPSLLKAEVGG
jgi:orotate phosphoribosyltransferase